MNYKEILSDKFSNLDEIAKQNQEIYKNSNGILLVGINEGVAIQFYEIARFTKTEIDGLA